MKILHSFAGITPSFIAAGVNGLCGLTFKSGSGFKTSQSVPMSYTKYLNLYVCLGIGLL